MASVEKRKKQAKLNITHFTLIYYGFLEKNVIRLQKQSPLSALFSNDLNFRLQFLETSQ